MTIEIALRRGRPFPGAAPHRLRQPGRLSRASSARCCRRSTQVKNTASIYRTPLIEVATKCVFTNTTLVSAYRGAGRPEGNYYIERADRLRCRRDGHRPHRVAQAQHHPQKEMPFKAASGHDLRLRRFSRRAQAGARGGRLCRLQEAQAREQEARQAARARRRLLSRSDRRRPARKWAASASTTTAR